MDAGGNINVVWAHSPDISFTDIFFSRSTDGGATFSTPKNLSNNTGDSSGPQIAVDVSGNISVVWADTTSPNADIFFSRSTDGGTTFSTPKDLSNNTGGIFSFALLFPQIAVDASGNINVVWANNTLTIFFSRSTDGGATFSTPKNLSNAGGSFQPHIAVDGSGKINVVWRGSTPGNADIFFSRSTDGGATFSTPQKLSNNTGESELPQMVVDSSGNINVVWHDVTPGNLDIFFSRSTDGGATFSTPKNLSNNTGNSSGPRIAVDGDGNSNVVWVDTTPGNSDIFFSRGVVNQPPVANAGPDQTGECTNHAGTPITLDGSNSSDPDGDPLSFVWKDAANNVVGTTAVVNLTLPLGTHAFTLTVNDGKGETASDSVAITVQDTTAPTLSLTLSPNVLWPPHHKLVQITATVQLNDVCDPNPTIELVSITRNEPDNGLGDGDTANDIQGASFGTDDRAFFLRAERSGRGTGRIYTVRYRARDASGNVAVATAEVRVPHTRTGWGSALRN